MVGSSFGLEGLILKVIGSSFKFEPIGCTTHAPCDCFLKVELCKPAKLKPGLPPPLGSPSRSRSPRPRRDRGRGARKPRVIRHVLRRPSAGPTSLKGEPASPVLQDDGDQNVREGVPSAGAAGVEAAAPSKAAASSTSTRPVELVTRAGHGTEWTLIVRTSGADKAQVLTCSTKMISDNLCDKMTPLLLYEAVAVVVRPNLEGVVGPVAKADLGVKHPQLVCMY